MAACVVAGVTAEVEISMPQWDPKSSPHRAWTNRRIRIVSDTVRTVLEGWRQVPPDVGPPVEEEELRQAVQWAFYSQRVTSVQVVVYANKVHENLALMKATAPFPLKILTQAGEWRGTIDKLISYWTYVQTVDDDAIVVFCDAFDVFGNGFDGHELLRRYFSFQRPVVIAAEENIFPREVQAQAHDAVQALDSLGSGNASSPSRFLNAGGVIGVGWALKRMYSDIRENMAANDPAMLMAHSDMVGHWFLHAYDQYEHWRYFIRHVMAARYEGEQLLLALDTEQLIFGSTVLQKENWPDLLDESVQGGVHGVHSIDVDVPLVFDAPQSLFEVRGCRARFVGRRHAPIFWHGQGPWKAAWEGLRNRLDGCGCFAAAGHLQPK
eukprot:CAMPEP_0204585794 /NCGR_PEP_ID=MMETSP0661-20131031/47125_1 /ASSEMBLY_ACC=CAM_ASM_000606 /TAXON_ID=109239 /ORGANISM="Alexandrium margalefi, Strain AMGDE01CS-322" /LENGTH=379 /DNA_ID=CAMNT_0051595379 /DNA_START=74 /DNA_END=1210 /DNA_ORIENTATION=+